MGNRTTSCQASGSVQLVTSAHRGPVSGPASARCRRRERPLRVFYAFDPRRSAILLIGGDKTGDDRFYERLIPVADELYDVHLKELKQEGLLK